jgi:hypothetical protein
LSWARLGEAMANKATTLHTIFFINKVTKNLPTEFNRC